MTVLSSAAAAVFVTAAILFPELGSAPRSAVPPIVLAHLPVLAVAALAIFGLCAILITATTLVAGIVRLRQQLARAATDGLAAGRELSSVFAGELRRLAPNPALTLAQSDRPGGNVASAIPLRASEARKEIARLYYISLARTHVLSAQIILAGIVGLGIAQDYGSLPLQPGRIPTVSAVLIMIGLLLLGILGRIAVDVTAEPL
ncbi:MAG TPA: hypothetical protein VE687_08395, partial [Stellaceae bacterium]|nr:hypothetical protein [Stellaceae bacterium]